MGGQRGDLGGQRRRKQLLGASRPPVPPRRGPPRQLVRARPAAAPGSCAPLPGRQPRFGECGLPVAGRAARERRASVSPASPRRLSRPVQGSAGGTLASHGRAAPGGAAGPEPGRPERGGCGGAPAAPRAGRGQLPPGQSEVRAAAEAAGLFPSFSYFVTQGS